MIVLITYNTCSVEKYHACKMPYMKHVRILHNEIDKLGWKVCIFTSFCIRTLCEKGSELNTSTKIVVVSVFGYYGEYF